MTISTLRFPSLFVLFLSGITMVGCFLWWGRLPLDINNKLTQLSRFVADRPHESPRTKKTKRPPQFVFAQSMEEGDDEDQPASAAGERIRNKNPKKTAKNDNKIRKMKQTNSPNLNAISKGNSNGNPQPNKPEMVWLMSYPNSGTSYTMTMVARASKRATASNYGRETTMKPNMNTPVYKGRLKTGPYYLPNPARPLPSKYILVKTHCGGRCVLCGPHQYMVNHSFFLQECTRGSGLFPLQKDATLQSDRQVAKDETMAFQVVHYDFQLVKKAIHLIRNPFDNIVSRFHLERKHWVEKSLQTHLTRYPNNSTGFQTWCWDMNARFGPLANDTSISPLRIPHTLLQQMQKVPCHGEFFKYTQWHNHAFDVMGAVAAQKPTVVLHYEEYESQWNQTVDKLMDFLALENVGDEKPFQARHDYGPYFTTKQRRLASALIRPLASSTTWEQIKRYMPKPKPIISN